LARLIRERPVFVNLAAYRHLPHRKTFETTKFVRIYQCLQVFPCEDGASRARLVIADLDKCAVAEPGYSRVRLRALDTGLVDISDP
jgi:hypothetical protein